MLTRAAIARDIPGMMAIAREAPSAAHWSQQQYEIAVSGLDRVALVIEQEFAIQGFVVARVVGREWEIENIVIASDRRKQGMGACLLAEIINRARQQAAEAVFLEVRASNRAARALYEKSGFVQTGQRSHYYHEPEENALVYRCKMG